jgi:predicted RNase H-like HicB family nuclease
MQQLSFKSVVFREEKHYVAQCLDVDIASFGASEKEALDNLKEALELYLEDQPKPDLHAVDSPKIVSFKLQHA